MPENAHGPSCYNSPVLARLSSHRKVRNARLQALKPFLRHAILGWLEISPFHPPAGSRRLENAPCTLSGVTASRARRALIWIVIVLAFSGTEAALAQNRAARTNPFEQQAQTAMTNRDFAAAIASYEQMLGIKAVELSPDDPDYRRALASVK